jgi:hypothetical protein
LGRFELLTVAASVDIASWALRLITDLQSVYLLSDWLRALSVSGLTSEVLPLFAIIFSPDIDCF